MKSRVYRYAIPVLQDAVDFLNEKRNTIGSKFYDCNPFGEVFQMRENVYSIFLEGAGICVDMWSHVIVGPERALVIDTGFGIGDLKALVEELVQGKPYDVVSSHPHGDHTMGNFWFDKAYCHEYAVDSMKRQMRPGVFDMLLDENGRGKNMDFCRDDLPEVKEYEIVGVPHGHIFDLGGGHEVEVIWMPGHCSSGICLLDKVNRILFTGDAINVMTMMTAGPKRPGAPKMPYAEYNCVQAFRDELEKFLPRVSEFDEVFPSHDVLCLPARIVTDMYEVCDSVVKDPDCHDNPPTFQYLTQANGLNAMTKTVGRAGIGYHYESVYPPKD